MFWKGHTQWMYDSLSIDDRVHTLDILRHEEGLLPTHHIHAALRYCLFEALGLRHTCCRSSWHLLEPPIDDEEAAELREEDRFRVEIFDELLPRAEAEWQRRPSQQSFSQFWAGFSSRYIEQEQQEGMDENYAKSLADAGVRLHEVNDEEE